MRKYCAVTLMALAFVFSPLAPAQSGARAAFENFISEVNSFWVPLNRNPNATMDSRRAWTQDFVNWQFDVPAISRATLGPSWNKLNKSEQAAYREVFRELLVETIISWLVLFDGEPFEIASVRQSGRNVEIQTKFTREPGNVVRATWVLRPVSDRYLFRDIRISGISLVADFRSKNRRKIDEGGVKGLFVEINNDLRKLRAENR